MINSYFPVLVLFCLAALFLVVTIALAIFIGPKRHSAVKDDPFECGTVGSGDISGRHGAKFYLVAMAFIVFDVEVVFLYPWAVNVRELGWPGFFAASPFLVLLIFGLFYEWKRKALDVS